MERQAKITRKQFVGRAMQGLASLTLPAAATADGTGKRPEALLEVIDWRHAAGAGWTFADERNNGHKGRISFPDGVLRLNDDRDGATAGPEAAWTRPLEVAERFVITFRARLLRVGLADESTGDQSLLRLTVGVQTPQGAFGMNVSVNGDRYNVDDAYKVWRTDARWHLWRLEADVRRRTVAMYRDGEYVCLHTAGATQQPGVRIQIMGTAQTPAAVEIDRLTIATAEAEPAPAVVQRSLKSAVGPGEWPLWRRDVRNTAVSPLVGNIREPQVAWSAPVGAEAVTPVFLDLDGDGRAEALLSHGGNLTALRLDGSPLWRQRLDNATIYGLFDLDGDGEQELVVAGGTPSQLHVLRARDGKVRYICPQFPKSGVAGIRIAKIDPAKRGLQAVVWSHFHEIGYCLSFTDGVEQGRVDWTFDWKQSFFTPLTALADMDRDGVLDLVVVTYNHAFVFDGRIGAQKMGLEWHSGRNYGTLVVKDIDGDGYPDIVILADVLREHVDVIKNEGGRSLRLLWGKFYEQNYPSDHVSLRVLTESVDDFDGDGKTEIVYGAYDDRTDGRWHTLVVDAVTGAVKRAISGRYPVGAGALFPGLPPALLLSKPSGREALNLNRLAVWSGAQGNWREQAILPAGALLNGTSVRDFASHTWAQVSGIATGTPTVALRRGPLNETQQGIYLLHPDQRVAFLTGTAAGDIIPKWQAALPPDLAANVTKGAITEVAQLVPDVNGPQRVYAGADGYCRILGSRGETVAKLESRGGVIVAPLVARLKRGEAPSIVFIDAQGSLQCLCAQPGAAPRPARSFPAQGCWSYYVPHSRPHGIPVIADVEGNGDKTILVAQKPNSLVALDSDGTVRRRWQFPALPQQWTVGDFDGDDVPDLLVTYPIGPILDVATVAVAGKDGRTLWRAHGGNGPAALFDMDGDGRDDVIMRDLYERRTLNGRNGRDILPIVMQQGYHTPVVSGADGGNSYPGVFWLGGSWAAQAEDAQGRSRWLHWLAPTGTQCVADIDGDGKYSVGGVTAGEIYQLPNLHAVDGPDREFLCYDALTGDLNWSLPLGTTSSGVAAADVDGDGKPEFLFGTADGRLIALRGGADAQRRVLWELTLPAALGPPIVCDVEGDGKMAILVSCADGRLYCVKQKGL
jgi:outer membrane protein assembly factor BamB